MGAVLLLSGCVPLSGGYVTLENDQLVLRTVCTEPIREVSVNLMDPRGIAGAEQWKVRAIGEPATSVVLNVPNPGYETVLDWTGPVADEFGVSFALGTGPFLSGMRVTPSEMTPGVAASETGIEDLTTYLKRRQQQLGCA